MPYTNKTCRRCGMKRVTKNDLKRSPQRLASAGMTRDDAFRCLPICRRCCTRIMNAKAGLRSNGSSHGMFKRVFGGPTASMRGPEWDVAWIDEVHALPE